MSKNYWSENESKPEVDPITSLLSEWSDPEEEEEEFRSDFFQGLEGRRKKAAFTLLMIWGITIGIHLWSWGYWLIASLTGLVFIHTLRLLTTPLPATPEPLSNDNLADAPFVSLLIAAKNEEAVIANLVRMLLNLDYPSNKYEIWVVDDHSTDKTPQILDKLAQDNPQLKVIHRPANAGGGKSGALNQVLSVVTGEIIGVFDADARVPKDLLKQVVPLFTPEKIGAVQVRKTIANAPLNFWTKGQMAEMALDSFLQQQRKAIDGMCELRGNGQFVRRQALDSCGGWNEQTITDDLDLTIRLHLDQWDIDFLLYPPVEEEGVTTASSLWHQRNRWIEGGYQRYLDYWRLIVSNRLTWQKKLDLISFVLSQYLLFTATIPDLLMSITRHRLPLFAPLSTILFCFSFSAMFIGLMRTKNEQKLGFNDLVIIGFQSVKGMIYMLHWFVVIPSVMARMSVRPKRLKWVKTIHQGSNEESFEF